MEHAKNRPVRKEQNIFSLLPVNVGLIVFDTPCIDSQLLGKRSTFGRTSM